MESFKVRNYKQENPNSVFPEIISLDQEEARLIRERLTSLLELSHAIDDLTFIRSLWKRSTILTDLNAGNDNFDFAEVVHNAMISPNDSVLINWDQMKTIDRIQFSDLCQLFEYIWYPSTDDIEVFDDTLSWMIFVSHSGEIGIAKLK